MNKSVRLLGFIFLAIGVLGFIPGITTSDGNLFGLFGRDAALGILHVITGLAALWLSAKGNPMMFSKIAGIVYAILGVLGLVMAGKVVGLFMTNAPMDILHLVLAAVLLRASFSKKAGEESSAMSTPATPTPSM